MPTPSFTFIIVFFFNDTATTEIYTLSLHDALPISSRLATRSSRSSHSRHLRARLARTSSRVTGFRAGGPARLPRPGRSEEHTSELQSRQYLVCRLLLEKKKKHYEPNTYPYWTSWKA